MSVKNFQRVMRAALFTPTRGGWGLPLLFWGRPGVAKSDIIESVAQSVGLPCEVLSPGERGEGAFGVTPVPTKDGYIGYPAPEWSRGLTDETAGLVFLDEINTAAPAIQSAMMGLLLKRRIGGHKLGRRVRMLGAANEVVDSAGGWDLSPPVANRLGHLSWEAPSESEWTDWLMMDVDSDARVDEGGALAIERKVEAAWPAAWAACRGLVAGFVRAKPDVLHKQPSAGHPDASKAWPSHRTWEFAARALASSRVHGLSEADGDLFAGSFVGPGVMGELIAYRASADLPDPSALLDGKVEWQPDHRRLDRTYAVIQSCSSLVSGQVKAARKGKEGDAAKANVRADKPLMARVHAFIDLVQQVSKKAKDMAYQPVRELIKLDLHDVSPKVTSLLEDDVFHLVEGKA